MLRPTRPSDEERAELRAVLDEELQRLPPKCRAVIVLSDLEGKTRKEVALQLGWPEGTVASRLARARARLAKRLARYGLAGSGALAGTLLSEGAASASVPTSLVASTVKAASLLAAGQAASGLISAQVAVLMEGALKTMLLNKVLNTTAILLMVAVCATGTGLVLSHASGAAKQQNATPAHQATSEAKAEAPAAPQGQGAAKEVDVAKELEKLKGVWVCMGYERDGEEQVGQQASEAMWNETLLFQASTLKVKDDWVSMSWERKGVGQTSAGAVFKLRPTTTPKGIDLTWKSVPAREFMPKGLDPAWERATWNEAKLDQAQPGVYSIEGDRLRLSWGQLGGDRPAGLKTKRGDQWTVHLYVKKDAPAPEKKEIEAGQDGADDAKKDLDRMQGTWRVVSSQVGDEKAAEDEVKRRKVTVKGNVLTYYYGNELNEKREGTLKLDPKRRYLDLTATFPETGATALAIYELTGDDDLKIGFGNDGLVRPRRWVIGKDDVAWLLVLKREQPENKPNGAGGSMTQAEKEALAHNGEAVGHLLKGDYDKAISECTAAIRLDPKNDQPYLNRGSAYLLIGENDKAIGDFDQAIRLNPKNAPPYSNRAHAYAAKGNYNEAIKGYQQAIKVEPENGDAYGYLADLLATCPNAELRDGKRAVELATKACELTKWNDFNSLSALAAAYAEVGDFKKLAEVDFQRKAVDANGSLVFKRKQDVEESRKRLNNYEEGKPYRRQPPAVQTRPRT